MPRLSPFTGLLYDRSRAGSLEAVTAPPYDTVDVDQQTRLRAASPYNIVHIDLPERRADDVRNDNQYTRAAALLEEWRRDGVLRATAAPALYPYEMRFRYEGAQRRIRGLICQVDVEPWGGAILPHEETLPGPVEDRLRLVRELHLNLSPVYALASDVDGAVPAFLNAQTASAPHASVVDEAGVEHRLWVSDVPSDPLVVGTLMIADGHHRYAMALRYRDEMRASRGPGPWDALMMLVVDAATEQPPVLPIHRLSPSTAGIHGERVRGLEEVLAAVDDEALTYGVITSADGAIVHEVARASGRPPTVCAITEQVEALREPSVLRFTPDAVAAEEAIRSRSAATAYLLPSTSPEAIRSVIDAGGRMPQKSTYFWPKPRTGLVLRPLDRPLDVDGADRSAARAPDV